MTHIDRRNFLKKITAASLGATLLKAGSPIPAYAHDIDKLPIPKRRLGKTEFDVTIVSLGGQSTIEQPGKLDESVEIINRALDLGINYIDTSEVYGNGISETYIGEVMKRRRDEVFLTTKTFNRHREGLVEKNFADSCKRLQTDYIDLYLMHYINDIDTLDTILDRNSGAVLAMEELRDKGKIGYIGISSHSTEVLTEALHRYDLDCVFLTINAAGMAMNQSPQATRSFIQIASEKDVGIIAMKLTGRNSIFNTGITMDQAIGYSLSAGRNGSHLPVATGVIGITRPEQLDQNVRLAKQYKPYTTLQMEELEKFCSA
ncbi:MAG: aldo/keto reductase [Balneolaceae bacterium]|nr:MAG: aldo/keto reductase [Balneolaceae bacterium]